MKPLLPLLLLAAAAPAPVRLLGPEVAKLDWNCRSLVAADLDGDGRTDLAVLNNDRAKIDLLYQRDPAAPRAARPASGRWEPVLEDSRLRKESLVTGISMFALVAADLDGDGRTDLAYTGKPDALTVRYQGPGGDWSRKRVLDLPAPLQWISTLRAADLDGDGKADLAVLAQKDLLVLLQDGKGGLAGPDRYPLADEGAYGLQAMDVDADGKTDLLFAVSNRRDALRLRLGNGRGGFGPERPFRMEPPRGILLPVPHARGRALAYVQNATGLLDLLAIEPAPPSEDPAGLQPRLFSTRAGAKAASAYALADLDGDGRTDLAATDPDGAELLVHLRQADGEFREALRFPAPADARSLAAADVDGSGRASLVLASPKERLLGICRMGPDGRLAYPQPLPCPGRPLGVAAGDLDGDADADLACLVEDGGKRAVALLLGDGKGAWQARTQELAGLKTDPRGIRILDADQDGKADLAVFVPQEPVRLLLQDAQGAFAEVQGLRKGLLDNLEPGAMSLADVDADGKRELLVAGPGFARALRVGPDRQLQVVDQCNARAPDDEIALALSFDLDADGKAEVLLAPRKDEDLQLLRRDAQGVFRFARALPLGRMDLAGAEVGVLDGRPELFLFGRDRFAWIPLGRPGLHLRSLGVHESSHEDHAYADLVSADLDGDGQADLALTDSGPERRLEVLSGSGAGWREALCFPLFQTDPHYQGRKGAAMEPREVLAADVTGDGRADLLLLVHDRLLVYPQD